MTKQNAVFIYKLVNNMYTRIATIPIPTAYANIPYSASQPNDHLGVASIAVGDFDRSSNPDIAVLWEGTGITRLQIIRNNGNNSFVGATGSSPSLDIINSTLRPIAGVTKLQTADVDGDGKDELILKLYDAAAQQSMNRTGWRPLMHMVNGTMQFDDIFNGADQATQLSQLDVGVNDTIEYMYGNFGTGRLDLLVSDWIAGVSANGFTVSNQRSFRVFSHQ